MSDSEHSPTSDTEVVNFEAILSELEILVAQMEKGDLPLEQALKEFERGIQLTRQCQQALIQAEQQVKILMADDAVDFTDTAGNYS